MNMQNILHNHARHAALFPLCNDFCSTVCYYFVKYFRKDLYSARLRCPLPSDGSLNSGSTAASYTLFAFADGCDTEVILLSSDGYAVVGNMRYRVSQKDMASLTLLFDRLTAE